jgi:hypothetical protein
LVVVGLDRSLLVLVVVPGEDVRKVKRRRRRRRRRTSGTKRGVRNKATNSTGQSRRGNRLILYT